MANKGGYDGNIARYYADVNMDAHANVAPYVICLHPSVYDPTLTDADLSDINKDNSVLVDCAPALSYGVIPNKNEWDMWFDGNDAQNVWMKKKMSSSFTSNPGEGRTTDAYPVDESFIPQSPDNYYQWTYRSVMHAAFWNAAQSTPTTPYAFDGTYTLNEGTVPSGYKLRIRFTHQHVGRPLTEEIASTDSLQNKLVVSFVKNEYNVNRQPNSETPDLFNTNFGSYEFRIENMTGLLKDALLDYQVGVTDSGIPHGVLSEIRFEAYQLEKPNFYGPFDLSTFQTPYMTTDNLQGNNDTYANLFPSHKPVTASGAVDWSLPAYVPIHINGVGDFFSGIGYESRAFEWAEIDSTASIRLNNLSTPNATLVTRNLLPPVEFPPIPTQDDANQYFFRAIEKLAQNSNYSIDAARWVDANKGNTTIHSIDTNVITKARMQQIDLEQIHPTTGGTPFMPTISLKYYPDDKHFTNIQSAEITVAKNMDPTTLDPDGEDNFTLRMRPHHFQMTNSNFDPPSVATLNYDGMQWVDTNKANTTISQSALNVIPNFHGYRIDLWRNNAHPMPNGNGSHPTIAFKNYQQGQKEFCNHSATLIQMGRNMNPSIIDPDGDDNWQLEIRPHKIELYNKNFQTAEGNATSENAILDWKAFKWVHENKHIVNTRERIESLEKQMSRVVARLNALTGTPTAFDINGYYPLYEFMHDAQQASPQLSAHTHYLSGTYYYMPDGVTMYHGNYVP